MALLWPRLNDGDGDQLIFRGIYLAGVAVVTENNPLTTPPGTELFMVTGATGKFEGNPVCLISFRKRTETNGNAPLRCL